MTWLWNVCIHLSLSLSPSSPPSPNSLMLCDAMYIAMIIMSQFSETDKKNERYVEKCHDSISRANPTTTHLRGVKGIMSKLLLHGIDCTIYHCRVEEGLGGEG